MTARKVGAWISVVLGLVLATVFLLSRSAAVEAVYPAARAKASFARLVWTRLVGAWRGASAEADNVRLRREVAALSLLGTDLQNLESENARLRAALDYVRREKGEWVAAAVMTRDGGAAAAHRTLRVDAGSLKGVRKDAAVVVPGGLVGRVTSVSAHTSEVTLFSDPSFSVACEIETGAKPAPRGVVSGLVSSPAADGAPVLGFKYLSQAGEVPPRARVVTSGLGGVFPRGIEVGTYLSEGCVLPAVDLESLEDVFIRREK